MQQTVIILAESVKADEANALKNQQGQNEMVKQRMMEMTEQANKTEEKIRAAQEKRDNFAAEKSMLKRMLMQPEG